MPIVNRQIEPFNISRVKVPSRGISNDLEYVFNASLCNVMKQLASLCEISVDLAGELGSKVKNVCDRTDCLSQRLAALVAGFNSGVFSVNKGTEKSDDALMKAYESLGPTAGPALDRKSMPACIAKLYDMCETPPPLMEMDRFRRDGKKSMKLYSNPMFFYELWEKYMLALIQVKDTKKQKRRKKRKKIVDPGVVTSEVAPSSQLDNVTSADTTMSVVETLNTTVPDQSIPPETVVSSHSTVQGNISLSGRESIKEVAPTNNSINDFMFMNEGGYEAFVNLPPPDFQNESLLSVDTMAPVLEPSSTSVGLHVAPVPSPPLLPPPVLDTQPPVAPPIPPMSVSATSTLPNASKMQAVAATATVVSGAAANVAAATLPNEIESDRNDLLSQIRKGIKLRGVNERLPIQERKSEAPVGTVQKIMEEVNRRRAALKPSSDNESEESDGVWTDSD